MLLVRMLFLAPFRLVHLSTPCSHQHQRRVTIGERADAFRVSENQEGKNTLIYSF
jgi:hypothetical protein